MSEPLLQIGDVADAVGLSLRTVRYYEQMGLLQPERRSEGGFRLYSQVQVDRLRLIKRMKPLGFHVEEMRQLLVARDTLRDTGATAAARKAARATLGEFAASCEDRVRDLEQKLAYAREFAGQLQDEAHSAP
jgi:MerR family transcriptional regulator, copper efflux regulator